jgi:scyllo-inositol 2-dehydrogenase (NADP+)
MMSAADDQRAFAVGIVGYGLAGAVFHAPLIRSTPGLHLAAVVTRDPERQQRAALDNAGVWVADSVAHMLDESRALDLIVVATPNDTHAAIAEQALSSGVSVVVDKPPATTSIELSRLINLAREKKRLFTVFQNRRWDGDFLTVQQLIRDGALGDIYRFESRFERWRPTVARKWREETETGGVLYDLGSHLIDQALTLFGPVADVYVERSRRRKGSVPDDDVFLALTHASGVYSHLFMSSVAAEPGPRMKLLGSLGAYTKWELDVQEAALRGGALPGEAGWGEEPEHRWGILNRGDGPVRIPTKPGSYQRFYAQVEQSLRNGTPPPVDPAETRAYLDIMAIATNAMPRTT